MYEYFIMKRKNRQQLFKTKLQINDQIVPAYYLGGQENYSLSKLGLNLFDVDLPDWVFHDFIKEKARPAGVFGIRGGNGNLMLKRLRTFPTVNHPNPKYWEVKSVVYKPPLVEEWQFDDENILGLMIGNPVFTQMDEVTGEVNPNMREFELPDRFGERDVDYEWFG